ncbi:branched-chain amino acid ABC transporter permease (plasmid) [Alloyangia pacifica]|uniref:Branched-chain amino acid ABC transporter permease n=1 Tax=Alloyangia pacifica TaxID=311180 RepID=A0A2U8HLN6_9RHOB|nr:branched-chain amino acid ABC transporter permease [Alloyangia pacifica]AWI86644.1 branched-chain amino acid ABC transporter permease [Alloyangia pacifica]
MMLQPIMDGLVNGAIIGLGAIGVTLTYAILRFANFAHGELLSWGAYLALTVSGALGALLPGLGTPLGPFSFGWSVPIAMAGSILLTAALTLAVDWLLFGRLRRSGAVTIILVMASFGAALALRNLLEFAYTSSPKYFSNALQISREILPGLRATPDQLLVVALGVVLVVLVHLLLTRTAAGRSMRAVSEDPQLSALVGIDTRAVIRMVWVLGAALAAVAGIMSGVVVQIRPTMGHDLLLPLFAAAILGGIGSVPGAMLAGLIVGLAEALTVQLIGAEWRAAVSFVILVAVLLLRPQGIFGKVTA